MFGMVMEWSAFATKPSPRMPCPHCGFRRCYAIRRGHRKCASCRREWSPGDQYPVPHLRLTGQRWRSVICAFLERRTIESVIDTTRIGKHQAERAVAHLREVMTRDVPAWFHGTCEADETYVGGTWKNKRAAIRIRGTKRGRGTQKQAIFGILNRPTKQVRVWQVPNVQGPTLRRRIRQHVARPGPIYTDGAKQYRKLPEEGYRHAWVDHDAEEFVRRRVHTQGIDGFWGYLKRHLAKIGGIRKRYLYRYIGEYVWRYNYRSLSRKEQIERLFTQL